MPPLADTFSKISALDQLDPCSLMSFHSTTYSRHNFKKRAHWVFLKREQRLAWLWL
jgi:hypothetical protein